MTSLIQGFQNAFISYGRADSKAFAQQLHDRLLAAGQKVWFDFNDIPLGVDYQNQIDDGIEKSDNFLFVIAPHSVNSPYCLKEVELALRRNKRIIPVLHVEQISREIWQQRNPNGTTAEWETYTTLGKHSSFPNMHPVIGKINWVYCREGIDDFETAFQGLQQICDRHRDYVSQHTQLLAKALEWERNQKQSRYLLVDEELNQAETWLKVRFKDEQPPCLPTDLHCEFITESIKHGHNQMTQVFLSYATEDIETMHQVGNSLRRSGFTIWTNKTDIQTGTKFQDAINRGIEEADNIVYLLSPNALRSTYCQQEIDYALSLNKRIIPLLVSVTDPEQIPAGLQGIQYIDLTDNQTAIDYLQDESQLIKILRQDADYYADHKRLLVKALEWKQQDRTSLLLRGYDLQQSEAWLKVGKQRPHHRPLPLHEQLIAESLAQPPKSLDVLIAYAPQDTYFARKLNDALQGQGKTTWFDQEHIASGSDLQSEIQRGIENADTLLWILSPQSVQTPSCLDALDYAVQLSKRVVTVTYRPVDPEALPPELSTVQTLDFNPQRRDFSAMFRELMGLLDTDREHLKAHTRLLLRAIEWEQTQQDESCLLRGSELQAAEQWLVGNAQKSPAPAELQQTYILTSRQLETSRQELEIERQRLAIKRQRMWLGAITVMSVMAIASAMVAVGLYRRSEIRRIQSSTQQAETLFFANDQLTAMQVALQVVKQSKATFGLNNDTKLAATAVLRQVLYGVAEQNRLAGHTAEVLGVNFSPDGQWIATASADGTAKLWSAAGQQLSTFTGHQGRVLDVGFSPDGQTLVTGSSDRTAQVWDKTGALRATLSGHQGSVQSVSFSPDGQTIATASSDHSVKLWTPQGKLLKTLKGHSGVVYAVRFSANGRVMATASADLTIKLWSREGQLLKTLKGHTAGIRSIAFSPKSDRLLASASDDKTIKLWTVPSLIPAGPSPTSTNLPQDTAVKDIAFSPDGKTVASASTDNVVNLWTLQGRLITSFKGHNDTVYGVRFSPDGKILASASADRTARLWRVNNDRVTTLDKASDSIYSLNYSPNGQWLAAGSNDGSVRLWGTRTNALINTLVGHQEKVTWVNFDQNQSLLSMGDDGLFFRWQGLPRSLKPQPHQLSTSEVRKVDISPDRTTLALATHDNTVELWDLNGKLLNVLKGHQAGVRSVAFSPNGQFIVSGDDNGMILLWKRDGTLLKQLPGHQGAVRGINFSFDGQLIASGGDDRTIRLWNVDGSLLKSLSGHTDTVKDLVFSQDSQFLASGGDDQAVILWKRDGTLLSILKGHKGPVLRVRFSPNNQVLATGSSDNTVKLWKLDSQALNGSSDTEDLIAGGCSWLKNYLRNNPTVQKSEQKICD